MNHFIDGGANIGQTFDFLIKTNQYDGWKIWCFEPSPRHFNELIKKASQYNTRYQIVICPFGLADKTEFVNFYEKINAEGDSFINSWNRNISTSGYGIMSAQIDIVKFVCDIIPNNDKVTIKLDVEGYEYNILERILQSKQALEKINDIMVEWHNIETGSGADGGAKSKLLIQEYNNINKSLTDWAA